MKLSDYLRHGPHMEAYGQFFNSPAGQDLLGALAVLAKPVPPNFPMSEGEAAFKLGYSCGADFMIGLIGSLRDLQSKLGSKSKDSGPSYGVPELLKKEWNYDDAGRAG